MNRKETIIGKLIEEAEALAREFDSAQLTRLEVEAEIHWREVKDTYEKTGFEEYLYYPPWPTLEEP